MFSSSNQILDPSEIFFFDCAANLQINFYFCITYLKK